MTPALVLIKSITLLYRESQLPDTEENSADLVRTVIDNLKLDETLPQMIMENSTIHRLKDIVMEMVNNPVDTKYDKNVLLQELKIACGDDIKLYDAAKQGIEPDLDTGTLKRVIVNLRRNLNNYYKEEEISKILSKASYEWKHHRDSIKNANQFLINLITKLESLELSRSSKDPAVKCEIDIGDTERMREILQEVKDKSSGDGVLRTGWQALNRMLQGGFRRGDFVVIGALQHKYKTGFTLSIFKQLALYNKPYMINPEKKPLLLRISFEDDITNNIEFLYKALKYDETHKYVDVTDLDPSEMAAYIKQRLSVNGYHIKMIRIDPTEWTYRDMLNKVIELEADGYEIHALIVDYLSMLPTIGCDNSGPQGSAIRDMFRRVRNFCSPKKITFITPHQLSSEAKQLIRNGVPDDRFVKEIAEKGYYDGSKRIDQEVDLELYIHIAKHKRKSYLTVQRGKHRGVDPLDDDEKYFMLPFPWRMPIPDDINGEDISLKKFPSGDTDDDVFSF